jgi:hypothetical protein
VLSSFAEKPQQARAPPRCEDGKEGHSLSPNASSGSAELLGSEELGVKRGDLDDAGLAFLGSLGVIGVL